MAGIVIVVNMRTFLVVEHRRHEFRLDFQRPFKPATILQRGNDYAYPATWLDFLEPLKRIVGLVCSINRDHGDIIWLKRENAKTNREILYQEMTNDSNNTRSATRPAANDARTRVRPQDIVCVEREIQKQIMRARACVRRCRFGNRRANRRQIMRARARARPHRPLNGSTAIDARKDNRKRLQFQPIVFRKTLRKLHEQCGCFHDTSIVSLREAPPPARSNGFSR